MLNIQMKKMVLGASAIMMALGFSPLQAADVEIAVAANFNAPLGDIITAFQNKYNGTGGYPTYTAAKVQGATGDLAAQIEGEIGDTGYSVTYDLLLAADDTTPAALYGTYGSSVVGAPFFYAQGYLVLWSKTGPDVSSAGLLSPGSHSYATGEVAIANPDTAPYGTAATEALLNAHSIEYPYVSSGTDYDWIFDQYSTIGSTFNAVNASTSSTDYPNQGFVAKSQVCYNGSWTKSGTFYEYPQNEYNPIYQDGTRLYRVSANTAAVTAFINFLTSDPAAQAIIQAYCYN